jgi:hypothetical protein
MAAVAVADDEATCENLPQVVAHMHGQMPVDLAGVPVGNSILLATDIESGDAPALCERFVA